MPRRLLKPELLGIASTWPLPRFSTPELNAPFQVPRREEAVILSSRAKHSVPASLRVPRGDSASSLKFSVTRGLTRAVRRAPAAFAAALALAIAAVPGAALAHVDIDVGDGQYVMEVGFRDEPAYLGEPNALFLSVEEYGTGGTDPVNDLAATLSAEVTKDGQSMNLSLEPAGDGEYEAAFVPTATGDYTFHLSGTIGEATVDESVTSGPTTFNSVEPLSAIEFPVAREDPVQIQAEASAARADAASARTFAFISIAVGVLGLILGVVALARSGRPKLEAVPRASEPSGKLIR